MLLISRSRAGVEVLCHTVVRDERRDKALLPEAVARLVLPLAHFFLSDQGIRTRDFLP